MMKAVRFSQFGGPEVLEIVDLPDPHPGPGQVRIAVRAAARAARRTQKLNRGVPRAHPPDPAADPEPLQHPQPVRRQRHARADLGQLLRLLVHPDIDPGLRQRNGRCHPAQAAADHHRPQRHALPPRL